MEKLNAKEFIRKILIDELGAMIVPHPYISFVFIAIGIEFLGKCLNQTSDWNKVGHSKKDFEKAINELNAFKKYRSFLEKYSLWTNLRNGLTHTLLPKGNITFSSKEEEKHFVEKNDKLNLKCEDFYNDFKLACEEVIDKEDLNQKIDETFIWMPGNVLQVSGGTTHS